MTALFKAERTREYMSCKCFLLLVIYVDEDEKVSGGSGANKFRGRVGFLPNIISKAEKPVVPCTDVRIASKH